MLDIKDFLLTGFAMALAAVAAFVGTKVGLSKDMSNLRKDLEDIQQDVYDVKREASEMLSKETRRLQNTIDELRSLRPQDMLKVEGRVADMQSLIQQNTLSIQKLQLEGAAADQQRLHQIEALNETKAMMRAQSLKADEFQAEVLKTITELSTTLNERTVNSKGGSA